MIHQHGKQKWKVRVIMSFTFSYQLHLERLVCQPGFLLGLCSLLESVCVCVCVSLTAAWAQCTGWGGPRSSLLVDAEQLSSLGKSEGKCEMLPHTQKQPGMVGNSGMRGLEEPRDKSFINSLIKLTLQDNTFMSSASGKNKAKSSSPSSS